MKRINKLFFCRVIDTCKADALLRRIDGTCYVILCSSDFGYLLRLGFRIIVIESFDYDDSDPLFTGSYTRALRRAHRVCRYIMYNRSLPNKL